MFQFTSEKVTDHIHRIHGYSDEQMYLIEGTKSAALIDTGTGIGDLKAYVDQLTEKPVTVILTHGHLDHALGAEPFDVVYMNHADDKVYEQHRQPEYRETVAGTYDRVLFSHGAVGDPAVDIIDNVIEACEIVKRGKAVNLPVSFADGTTGMMAKAINE